MNDKLNPDLIPMKLRTKPQWVAWKGAPKENGKLDKIPINPVTGMKAKVNDPATWTNFRTALLFSNAMKGPGGVGFVFTENDPCCGVDLDDCVGEDGHIADWAISVLDQFGSYSEFSPSKRGIKIFGEGKLPGKGVQKNHIELYDRGRFFTVTGWQLRQYPSYLENVQKPLSRLYKTLTGDNGKREPEQTSVPAVADQTPVPWQDDILKGVDSGGRHAGALRLAARWANLGHSDAEIVNFIVAWNEKNRPPKAELSDPNSKELQDILAYVRQSVTETVDPDRAIHLSDLGNARILLNMYGDRLHFCYQFMRWYIWDDKKWREDETGVILRLAKRVAKLRHDDANACADKDLHKLKKRFATDSENINRLRSLVTVAQSESGIPIMHDQLDRHPWLFNCWNGTLDISTGVLSPHEKENLITFSSRVAVDLNADCPRWRQHLNFIFEENTDLISFMQRAWGSCLSGVTRDRKLYILHGSGRNGKSLSQNVISTVLGPYAMRTPASTLMVKKYDNSIPNDLARLRGARFVYTSETEAGAPLAESLIKDITGGELITARFLRAEFFEFEPQFKVFMTTNHRPTIQGDDPAIWDRIALVPFNRRIDDAEIVNADVLMSQFREEAPGILGWLFQGARDWYENGLRPPDEVKAAVATYRDDMDLLGDFLSAGCQFNATFSISVSDLYLAYATYCEDKKEKPMRKDWFGRRLAAKGFLAGKKDGVRIWRGLGLKAI